MHIELLIEFSQFHLGQKDQWDGFRQEFYPAAVDVVDLNRSHDQQNKGFQRRGLKSMTLHRQEVI